MTCERFARVECSIFNLKPTFRFWKYWRISCHLRRGNFENGKKMWEVEFGGSLWRLQKNHDEVSNDHQPIVCENLVHRNPHL